jgi:hypothetical protein
MLTSTLDVGCLLAIYRSLAFGVLLILQPHHGDLLT